MRGKGDGVTGENMSAKVGWGQNAYIPSAMGNDIASRIIIVDYIYISVARVKEGAFGPLIIVPLRVSTS